MLIFGALAIGSLDFAYAARFYSITALRTDRSITGVSGIAGIFVLYGIAFLFVLGLWAVYRVWPKLLRHSDVSGPLYGVGVVLFTYYVIIPLSRTPPPLLDSTWAIIFVMAQAAILGMFAAMCASAAVKDADGRH